ncbi:MAG: hypothetical protein HFG80_01570 [Eubacterium sp.]|nr:hypothetical protein [Eubacterium sp.]
MNQNTRIRISFIVVALIAVGTFFISYRLFSGTAEPEQIPEIEMAEYAENTENTDSTETKEAAEEEETVFETAANEEHVLFLIKKNDGYLDVYLADGVTLYMTTGIMPEELEEEWQAQLEEGIAFYSIDSLYQFLESYSS